MARPFAVADPESSGTPSPAPTADGAELRQSPQHQHHHHHQQQQQQQQQGNPISRPLPHSSLLAQDSARSSEAASPVPTAQGGAGLSETDADSRAEGDYPPPVRTKGDRQRKRRPPADDGSGGKKGGGKKRRGPGGRAGGLLAEKVAAWEPPGVALSRTDCAPQLMLSKDQLTVTGEKGFRMVRATAGASEGAWYFEVLVLPPARADGHVRIGWSTGAGDLQAPVGYDRHSYAYRDLAGSRVHASLRHDGYGAPYGPGDVVGAQIVLAGPSDPSGAPTSAIRFFVNGVDQGVAYTALAPAAYLPAVSLYMGARVRVNFGPRFVCAPPPLRAEESHDAPPRPPRAIAELRPMAADALEAQAAWARQQRAEREEALKQKASGEEGIGSAIKTESVKVERAAAQGGKDRGVKREGS